MSEPNGYNLGNDFDLFLLIHEQLKIRIPKKKAEIEDLKCQLGAAEIELQQLIALDRTTPEVTSVSGDV